MEKRGKTAPARERRKVLAAMAEAALWEGGKLDVGFFLKGGSEGGIGAKEKVSLKMRGYVQHKISIDDVIKRL